MNKKITFKANFDIAKSCEQSSGYAILKGRKNNIDNFFKEYTKDEPNYNLKLIRGSCHNEDKFLLKNKVLHIESQTVHNTAFCKDLHDMDDKTAAKKLTKIFKAMKFKEEQERIYEAKLAERNRLIAAKDKELSELAKQQNKELKNLLKELGLAN